MFSYAWEPQILQEPQVRRQSTRIRHHLQPFPNPWEWAMRGPRIETQWAVPDNICMSLYGLAPHDFASGNPLLLEGGGQYTPGATQNLPLVWVPPATIALGPQGFRGWEWGSIGVVGRCTETKQNTGPVNTWGKKG